jgi:hypothetical protein
MNPYEATLPNVLARIAAWLRGLLRLYRRPLLIALTTGTMAALALGTTFGPAATPATATAHR